MKRTMTLMMVIAMLFTAVIPAFAENQTNPVGLVREDEMINIDGLVDYMSDDGISTRSNRFRYYYTETPYSYHTTSIATEEDIDAAIEMAGRELNIAVFFLGGAVGKVAVKAALSNVAKNELKRIVIKQAKIASGIAVTHLFISEGMNYLRFKAVKSEISKKTKTKWRENLATGRVDAVSEWVTYKRVNYYREGPNSSWMSNGTTYDTIRIR